MPNEKRVKIISQSFDYPENIWFPQQQALIIKEILGFESWHFIFPFYFDKNVRQECQKGVSNGKKKKKLKYDSMSV